MVALWLVLPGLFIWLIILLLPWRPWSTRESLDSVTGTDDLSGITVIIPARNEAETIRLTLSSIAGQGNLARILLVDDQSTDQTSSIAGTTGISNLKVINGVPLPEGWSGKLWALEQGRRSAATEYLLLVDADIELKPGLVAALHRKAVLENLQLVSLMADLRMENFWEKLLLPAFIYFFKLLYPFSISNSRSSLVAAAAGGCILIRADTLEKIGGFSSLCGELIDDCALARRVKDDGGRTWLGLTRSVISHRQYPDLKSIGDMVSRTAYTQLRYSAGLLAVCTVMLITAFVLPVITLLLASGPAIYIACATFLIIWGTYLPIIRYYSLNPVWALWLPFAGILYLMMTWHSAIQHWNGKSAIWKDRIYNRHA